MPDSLVVNASPLIFLGNGNRLELLRDFTEGAVIVPEVVLEEILSASITVRLHPLETSMRLRRVP